LALVWHYWPWDMLFPGATFEWSIFGDNGGPQVYGGAVTNAVYFYKSFSTPVGSPASASNDAFSIGSNSDYGLAPTNGFFVLTISPDAKEPQ